MTRFDPVACYAASNPQALAVVDLESGRRWTYAQLHEAIDRLAAWLVEGFGPASGVRLATLAKNCADMLILQLAGIRAGTIFTPFNWRLAPAEIEALAADALPEIVFHDEDFAPPESARNALPIARLTSLGSAGAHPPSSARRAFDAVATLLYTSGTSGRPKGVMLSEQNAFWGCTNFILGNDVTLRSVFLCDMPLFHTAGLFAATRAPIQAGGCVLISQGFDAQKTLDRLTDPALGVTHYFSVPQMAARIWNQPGFDPASLHRLVSWAIGGAPNPKALTQRFVDAGVRIAEGFGMSESGSNFGMPAHDLEVLRRKAGSCGLPFMTVEPRIVDEDGNDVPAGQVGELWMRGPCITHGYWNQPETTAKAFRDGWFVTGDAARMDEDGFYYIVDRRKDMYISGGENVYPAEVEATIAELSQVAECAVVGVPDERWGEVGRAYVIPVAGQTLTTEVVTAHCLRRLAKYKVPASVVITDRVQRTASGKVQKHLLKLRAMQELAMA
ncbi:MAG: AMP-binding protein [Proteobacteria bacterium]|nr:AMP-binding protein [Pseudomonadota bacterium]